MAHSVTGSASRVAHTILTIFLSRCGRFKVISETEFKPAGADDQEPPKKGLFSLPFMARAAERQKRAAAADAARLLNDIERDELATGGKVRGAHDVFANGARELTAAEETVSGSGRRTFGGAASARDVPANGGDDDLGRLGPHAHCGLVQLCFCSLCICSVRTKVHSSNRHAR